MKRDRGRESEYVRRIQEDTRRYVQSLLKENETLRSLLAKAEGEKLTMEEELLTVREQVDRHRREQIYLQKQLAEIEADNQRFTKEYTEIELQNSNLANLYVTSYRLHGTLERQEVLETIQEIIVNLVGSEELGIFEFDRERTSLRLVRSMGIDEEHYQSVALGSGPIGHVAETGETYFKGDSIEPVYNTDDDLTACIPLRVDGRVTGAIAVFRLLPQKTGLEPLDHELFELLATQAASALYCTGLHTKLSAGAEVL